MTISGVTSSTMPSQWAQSVQSRRQEWKQDFQSLGTALQAGDLSGAQSAFAALQQMQSAAPTPPAGPTGQATQAGGGSGPLSADISALSSALQSGDLTSAQTAFTKLQQDMQAVGGAHHRHHHHHAPSATQAGATDSASRATGSSAASPAADALSSVNLLV